jgi:hypothetical protein
MHMTTQLRGNTPTADSLSNWLEGRAVVAGRAQKTAGLRDSLKKDASLISYMGKGAISAAKAIGAGAKAVNPIRSVSRGASRLAPSSRTMGQVGTSVESVGTAGRGTVNTTLRGATKPTMNRTALPERDHIMEAAQANEAIWGSKALGSIKSVDDVSRSNPAMKYMGSAGGRLPGASKEGDGVIDYFMVGNSHNHAGREMLPMVMRQRIRTGYDASGKAIYNRELDEVIKQPMYRSTGQGSHISTKDQWVPFSEVLLGPKHRGGLESIRQRLGAKFAPHAKVMSKTDEADFVGTGSPFTGESWVGKHWMSEKGYQHITSKKVLDHPYLESARPVIEDFLKRMGAAV